MLKKLDGLGFWALSVICLLSFGIVLSGCGRSNKAIQIKGSDTMVNLGQAWAEEYMKIHPDESVAVTGGGSGTGIAALINGTTDIAQTSREMEKNEILTAEQKKVEPKEFHVANDGITIVVNPKNPVSKLTIKQLSDIYTAKVKNWKELGGPDQNIVALSRDRNSGTHVFFSDHVVKLGDKNNKNEFAPNILMMPSSQAIVEEIIGNPAAIGYIGLGYLNNKQKPLAIAKDLQSPYILPSVQTVSQHQYPISRTLLFYTNGEPNAKIKKIINFVLSPAGQKIVLKMDFVPVK
jgi:phosphate transport system substrate-binding protein